MPVVKTTSPTRRATAPKPAPSNRSPFSRKRVPPSRSCSACAATGVWNPRRRRRCRRLKSWGRVSDATRPTGPPGGPGSRERARPSASVTDREAPPHVLGTLDLIDEGDGEVRDRDVGALRRSHDRGVATGPVEGRSRAVLKMDRRGEKRPLELPLGADQVEGFSRLEGAGFGGLGKFGGIDKLHAGSDFKAPGAADDQESAHPRPLDALKDRLRSAQVVVVETRVLPPGVERADDDVVTAHPRGDLVRIEHVEGHDRETFLGSDARRVSCEERDLVESSQEFRANGRADESGPTEERYLHVRPPPRPGGRRTRKGVGLYRRRGGTGREECSRRDSNPRYRVEGAESLTGLDYRSAPRPSHGTGSGAANELSRRQQPHYPNGPGANR